MRRLLVLVCATAWLSGCTTATQREMKQADTALILSQEKSLLPDWAASRAAAQAVQEHVRRGIEARPIRPIAGGVKLDLRPFLAAFEDGPLRRLDSALLANDRTAVKALYPVVQSQCNSCHAMIGKSDIKPSALITNPQP